MKGGKDVAEFLSKLQSSGVAWAPLPVVRYCERERLAVASADHGAAESGRGLVMNGVVTPRGDAFLAGYEAARAEIHEAVFAETARIRDAMARLIASTPARVLIQNAQDADSCERGGGNA